MPEGGELFASSWFSLTGATELDMDRRSSLGRCERAGWAPVVAAAIALIPGGIEERRLLCLYVGEPSITE